MKLSYPQFTDKPIVSFHYEFFQNEEFILNVPDKKFENSDTYKLSFKSASDCQFVFGLKNGEQLYDTIRMYGNVAYVPKTGVVKVLEDRSNEEASSRLHGFVASAERVYRNSSGRTHKGYNERAALWYKKSQ